MVGAPTAPMTAPMTRRRPLGRAVVALSAVALLALLALAALVLGGAFGDHARPGTDAHAARELAVGTHDDAAPAVHAVHQQPSTRARSVTFAMLAATVVVALWPARKLRLTRVGRLRALRICGLPPGRAPPVPRIA